MSSGVFGVVFLRGSDQNAHQERLEQRWVGVEFGDIGGLSSSRSIQISLKSEIVGRKSRRSARCRFAHRQTSAQISLLSPRAEMGLVIAKAHSKVALPYPGTHMSLASLLSAEQIIPEMEATERWPAIVELIDLLVSQNRIKSADRESILASLKQREETMSTGIGFGIAIPHASSDRIEQVVASFGRSSKGIEFDALDNAPVKFVVLFVVPKNQFQTHLRTLASIAKFLNDRATREALANAKSSEEILAIFRDRPQK